MGLNFKLEHTQEIEGQSLPQRRMSRLFLLTFGVLWLLAIGVGVCVLCNYENTPGVAATPPERWPVESRIELAPEGATLVMLVHPHCPCTRATIAELAVVMAHCQGRLTAYVLFLKPEGFSDDWEKTDLWQSATSITGVHAIVDGGGAEALRFHAATSGQAMLYAADGRLLFSGGITGSRGHQGDNAGQSGIISLVNEGAAERTETFVFGCPLFDENSDCRKPKK